LKGVVEAVKPKHLVPIHAFDADRYGGLFEGADAYEACLAELNDRFDLFSRVLPSGHAVVI
jgi:hypothetical protein